jgi:hypothetical protein
MTKVKEKSIPTGDILYHWSTGTGTDTYNVCAPKTLTSLQVLTAMTSTWFKDKKEFISKPDIKKASQQDGDCEYYCTSDSCSIIAPAQVSK